MSHQHSRRDFLRTTGVAAAAGIAAPYFFSSAQATAAEAKNDRLTVAAIGVGGRGSDIGEEASRLGNMVACADVDLRAANRFVAEKIQPIEGHCEVFQDYRKILDRKDVEAVTIGTPDHWHTKVAIDAMKAGKDVYCEKPLTLTIEESKQICKVAKETGRVFQVGTQQRSEYKQGFLEAVAIAQSGKLGKQLHATAFIGPSRTGGPFGTGKPPKELDWDMWLGQAPAVDFCDHRFGPDFRWWVDYSGGDVTDWGVHNCDIALWALGGSETGIVEVDPVEGKCCFPLGRELMLAYLLGRKKPSDLANKFNVVTTFECNMLLPNGNTIKLINAHSADVIIEGEHGKVAVNRGGSRGKFIAAMKADPAQKDWLDAAVSKLYGGKKFRPAILEFAADGKTLKNKIYQGHMGNFFDCVKDRSLPVSNVFTHVNSVNACHMANISMLVGHKVKWDPAEEEFLGDDDANDLVARRQREPYAIKA
jgi:myo-inositol 2-dehydrogenase / D-chiro-inositol 1-dehydrogenase